MSDDLSVSWATLRAALVGIVSIGVFEIASRYENAMAEPLAAFLVAAITLAVEICLGRLRRWMKRRNTLNLRKTLTAEYALFSELAKKASPGMRDMHLAKCVEIEKKLLATDLT